jgi:hypothetical protein
MRVYWRDCTILSPIGKNTDLYWRKYSGHSPIGESHDDVLTKVHHTFAIGECPVDESLISEVPLAGCSDKCYVHFDAISRSIS